MSALSEELNQLKAMLERIIETAEAEEGNYVKPSADQSVNTEPGGV